VEAAAAAIVLQLGISTEAAVAAHAAQAAVATQLLRLSEL